MRYAVKRFYCWSGPIAYSVGLMASDGCLQSNGRHLDLTSLDISQLENFSAALGRDLTISKKTNASKQQAYRIQFSDVAYYDFLIKIGLTPRKSKTIGELEVPDKYYGDFLRGVFDGDGSTYSYYDPRWRSSYVFYVAFSGASLGFLQYLATTNSRISGTKGQSIRKGKGALSLVYGKADSTKLFNLMYRDAGNLYLQRKKEKLERFIIEDRNATILRSRARVVKW